jgi:uncharacterized membrane protein
VSPEAHSSPVIDAIDAIDCRQIPTPAVQATRYLALVGCVALIVLGLAWEWVLAPTGRGTLALKVLPLVAALPGLWRMRLYTYRWLSLALWLYVTEGAVRAGSEHGTGAWLASSEVVLAITLFAVCATHIRLRLARGRLLAETHTGVSA